MKNRPLLERLGFGLAGIAYALRTEHSVRGQWITALVVLAFTIWARPAPLWWAVVALTIGTILAAELFNTAIEQLADHLHPEDHPNIRIVKDCAAGGVLLVNLGAVAVAAALVIDVLRT